jgi:hypothetical protein
MIPPTVVEPVVHWSATRTQTTCHITDKNHAERDISRIIIKKRQLKSYKVDWLTLALGVVYLRRCAVVRYTAVLYHSAHCVRPSEVRSYV